MNYVTESRATGEVINEQKIINFSLPTYCLTLVNSTTIEMQTMIQTNNKAYYA